MDFHACAAAGLMSLLLLSACGASSASAEGAPTTVAPDVMNPEEPNYGVVDSAFRVGWKTFFEDPAGWSFEAPESWGVFVGAAASECIESRPAVVHVVLTRPGRTTCDAEDAAIILLSSEATSAGSPTAVDDTRVYESDDPSGGPWIDERTGEVFWLEQRVGDFSSADEIAVLASIGFAVMGDVAAEGFPDSSLPDPHREGLFPEAIPSSAEVHRSFVEGDGVGVVDLVFPSGWSGPSRWIRLAYLEDQAQIAAIRDAYPGCVECAIETEWGFVAVLGQHGVITPAEFRIATSDVVVR
jgi:hypothetical protein